MKHHNNETKKQSRKQQPPDAARRNPAGGSAISKAPILSLLEQGTKPPALHGGGVKARKYGSVS